MEKYRMKWHGNDYYLLGADREGTKYFLEQANFDCDWYWGGGYVETFTNNRNPKIAKDIETHQHFDSLFFNKKMNGHDVFKVFFEDTPLTDKEVWTLCELMKSFYLCRNYSDMLYTGGAHYTSNPATNTIQNTDEYNRINREVIPEIMNHVYKLLTE